MSKFYEHIMQENEIICNILKTNNEMHMMTEKQKNDYDVATHCGACGKVFTEANRKVRHHCHVSGKFLYAACNNCNIQLKVTSRKRKTRDDDECDSGEAESPNFFLPVVFHNLKCYDAHFVIKHVKKSTQNEFTITNHRHTTMCM